MIRINLDNTQDLQKNLGALRSGDRVLLSGTIYTARDAVHKRLATLIDQNQPLPIDFSNTILYYAGPTDTPPGKVVGAIGPTTSARMDGYAHYMKKLGVVAVIGKGERSDLTKQTFARDKIIYFIATGGCGALLSNAVIKAEVVAFDFLGCESVKRLTVKDFPVTCCFDLHNGDIYND